MRARRRSLRIRRRGRRGAADSERFLRSSTEGLDFSAGWPLDRRLRKR